MGTLPVMKVPYGAVMNRDWEGLAQFYAENPLYLRFPITCTKETALHMAVYSMKKKPLEDLLALSVPDPVMEGEDVLSMKDAFGNTVLHAAVVARNMEAVRLLAEQCPQLLTTKNEFGETPLFRAASFGELQIVNYLVNQPRQREPDEQKLIHHHRQRNDCASILHVAILGEHFETASKLLELDESLAELKDLRKLTAFHLLANQPSNFKSGYRSDLLTRFLYFLLPVASACDVIKSSDNSVDLESCWTRNQNNRLTYLYDSIWGFLSTIWVGICKFFFEGWPIMEKIWKEKKNHSAALRLANELVKKEISHDFYVKLKHLQEGGDPYITIAKQIGAEHIEVEQKTVTPHIDERESIEEGGEEEDEEERRKAKSRRKQNEERVKVCPTPLLSAASRGIKEIVEIIHREYPQALEQLNGRGQNILHVAIMYRQREILRVVKSLAVSGERMVLGVDNRGYTLLHHAADMSFYAGGTKPGPVLQLQEELRWFELRLFRRWRQESVNELIPSYYAAHIDKKNEITARQLFEEEHRDQLEKAREWIKKTSEACSAVAVLVAIVVFAAAYTAPGGYEKGIPIFLHSPYFMAFTILDVIALASSLTSVVMFLSILTSPFDFEDFHRSLPQKLTLGLTLLFFSVMTTMFAFASTILLTIRLQKQWTTSLISIAAFLPVTMYALMQFRLYFAFLGTAKDFFEQIYKALPWFLAPTRYLKRKQD